MPLQRELETLDGLPETLTEHYVQDPASGKFILHVDGMVPKTKLDEFRTNNTALMRERDQVKLELENLRTEYGVEPAQVHEMQQRLESYKDKKVLDDDGIEALVDKRISSLKAEKDSEIKARDRKIQELAADREHWAQKFQRTVIDRKLGDAAAKAGVRPTAIGDVMLRGTGMWHLNEDGNIVAKDHNGDLVYGADGVSLLSPEEWVDRSLRESAPHFFEASTGGGAPGGGGPGGSARLNVRSKSDLKTVADKSAFIAKYGLDAWQKLPAGPSGS